MVTKGDPERESRDEANDVSDVSNVGIIAGYQALFVNHDDVVDEVDDGDQSLGGQEEPRKLERFHEHDARRQSEDRGGGAQHAHPTWHKRQAEDETRESARKEDHQVFPRANGFLQRVSEDE